MQARVQDVEGSVNLRDFGGYRSSLGPQIKTGLLFRSGTLAYLTDRGKEQFHELGIELICDLRRPDEKEHEPTTLERPARLEIPIDPGSAVELREKIAQGIEFQERVAFMTALTGELPRDHKEDYATMFDGLLGMQSGGFLVHCSAGKDRTGFACALIQHALGVPQETVIRDYMLTNEVIDYEGFILPRLVKNYEADELPDKDTIMTIAGVRQEYLSAAYQAIEAEFEHVEHYLHEALDVGPEALKQLRQRYLEEA